MAKWEIIEDIKFKKANGGKSSASRAATTNRFNIPVIKTPFSNLTPTSTYKEPSTVLIKDNRKINPVTNTPIKPTRDLKSGNYSASVVDAIISQAINNDVDPYKALAVGLQESKLDSEVGHAKDYSENSFYTDPEKLNQMTQEQKLAFTMVNAMKDKEEYAKKLGYSDDAHYLQAYNGFGNLTPRTEKKYHNSLGVGTNSFYGIDVTKNPINTAKNPVYGKTVLSLANMLKTNPTIIERVGAYDTFNNLLDKSPVGLIKQPFKNGGVIKNPKYATGGKVSGWEIIDDIPKFKRGGKNNLNSTVEEEPKNTVKVNQNGQIIEYDPSSPEYKKLYESGTLTSYDPETDAYITPTLKEFTVVGEKPKWAKEKENNQSKYSKDWYIDNYLPKFSRNMGISADNMNPNDVERYNSFINDKTAEDIFKRYPTFDSDYANNRLETLKQFSPKEVELIKNSSYANKIEPSIWQDFEQGLLSFNSGPVQFKNENLTQEEAKEKSNPLGLLAPLSIPYNMTLGNVYTQQQGEKNYSWEKALKGQKPIYNSTAASIAGDPLNLLGLGLFKGLVSAGKIAKLEDAYQLVKGLGKEEALSKLKSLTSLDNIGKNSFTPVLDNAGVEAFGAIDYRNNSISDKVKEMFKRIDEEMRFSNLPETTNKQSLGVLEDFKTRIQTPEGQKRMKELGITEEQLLQDLKIVEDPNTFGYYTSDHNKITMNPNSPLPKKVVRHEIEHGVQNAISRGKGDKLNRDIGNLKYLFRPKEKAAAIDEALKGTSEIDDILSEIELRKEGTPNKTWDRSKVTDDKPVDISQYKSAILNKQNATDYFLTGSQGKEKSAFLGEVQQYMMDQGIIPKNSYTEVTPEMVHDVFVDAMFDEEGGGKYLRLFNIMKPTETNYKLISKGLNKMLGLTGTIGVGVGAASALQQKKHGGIIEDPMGQWAHPGAVTRIPSNQITMQGVNYPVLGISDRGHTQMMYPGEDYSFRGKSVTEYPIMGSGGEVNFTYAGENHRVYEKESPTGNGKGIEGHIMVNHPTKNKGKWDTIDLTKITNGRVKTVAQGVASTKKWHKENPEYADGGMIKRADGSYSKRGLWDNIRDNAGSGKKPTKEMLEQERKIKSQYATGGQVSNWEIIEDLPPQFQKGGKTKKSNWQIIEY